MNAARGEVGLVIGGRERRLCLTLGARAETEAAFGCDRMSELDPRVRALRAADMVVVLVAQCPAGELSNLPETVVLGGGNVALLETDAGWELVQFAGAELMDVDTWSLSGLLRGQQGSESAAAESWARFVPLDDAVIRASVSPGEAGLDMDWRVAGNESATTASFADAGGLVWSVAHLRRSGDQLWWTRRGGDVAESWTCPRQCFPAEQMPRGSQRLALMVATDNGFQSAP